jgi:hypothetical protein
MAAIDADIMEAINEVRNLVIELEEAENTTRRMITEKFQACNNQAEALRPEIIPDLGNLPNAQRRAYVDRENRFNIAKLACLRNRNTAERALHDARAPPQGGVGGGKRHYRSKKNRKLKRHRYTRHR